jgi:hypothetical protein
MGEEARPDRHKLEQGLSGSWRTRAEVPEAMRALEAGKTRGKIVITV